MHHQDHDQGARARSLNSNVLVFGALVLGGLLAFSLFKRQRHRKRREAHVEKVHDKTLKDSFPASDPPASQYFDIPVNRQ